MMKIMLHAFDFLAFSCGMFSAYFWYRASQVMISPAAGVTGDTYTEHMGWTVATMQAFSKSSQDNKTVALLTAITVFFTGIGSLISIYS